MSLDVLTGRLLDVFAGRPAPALDDLGPPTPLDPAARDAVAEAYDACTGLELPALSDALTARLLTSGVLRWAALRRPGSRPPPAMPRYRPLTAPGRAGVPPAG
ncbi:hypothetical protein [Geodermatophilus sp. SYSU D00079]